MSDYCVRHGGTIHVDKSGACKMCRATKDVMDQAGLIAELEENVAELKAANRWISVDDRLPEDGQNVLVYTPESESEYERIDFEFFEDDGWRVHNESYDHYMAVGGPNAIPGEVSTGPNEKPDYTHWQPLPPPPEAKQ